jgi:pilus assembly protein Flp/PilA
MGIPLMLKFYVKTCEAVKRLGTDQDGVVSFEYVIVAACIIAVVAAAFSNTGPLNAALTSGLSAIGTALSAAVTAA